MAGIDVKNAPSLEALLNDLRSPIRHAARVVLIAAAAGDYTAADVISNSATADAGVANELPNAAREPGGVATIVAVRVKCSEDAVLATLKLHFFDEAPLAAEVEMDDNAAYNVKTAAGHDKHLGSILLNAMTDKGTTLSSSDTVDITEPFKCRPGYKNLWFVVETTTAEANETAGMSLTFDFYCL